jgi:peptide deformylase
MRIITAPHPVLRALAAPIAAEELAGLRETAWQMAELMYKSQGCGLAAPQVGLSKQLIVVDTEYGSEPAEDDGSQPPDAPSDALPDTLREAPPDAPPDAPRDASENVPGGMPRKVPKNPIFYVNPQVVRLWGEKVAGDEGCLSIPGIQIPIKRYLNIELEALDLEGKPFTVVAEGFEARALQHELDHLKGTTMFEHLDPITRLRYLKEYDEALAAGAQPGDVGSG